MTISIESLNSKLVFSWEIGKKDKNIYDRLEEM